ncbi:MAG TPA: 5-deoxy-glucuronate isomerase [Anaerolineae bacterium]|nr:5-deoxy-glucuronate isomerase [Anaerolineae bacterium]
MEMFQKVPTGKGLNNIDASGMKLLNFHKLILASGDTYTGDTDEYEILFDILGGKANFTVKGKEFGLLGGRPNPFAGKGYSVYAPSHTEYTITAPKNGMCDIALCCAKSDRDGDSYAITPEEVATGTWGATNFTRFFKEILLDNKQAHRLFAGETIVPSGNWATFPPHKHEVDDLPREVYMEEIYYYKVLPSEGFGLGRHYKPGSYDRGDVIKDDTVLLMPDGYHTLVTAPGYQMFYIWFLAGNIRKQCPVADPDFAWVQKTIPIITNSKENL